MHFSLVTRVRKLLLFLSDDLELHSVLAIGPSTCRTKTIHVSFDVVEAELADLEQWLV